MNVMTAPSNTSQLFIDPSENGAQLFALASEIIG